MDKNDIKISKRKVLDYLTEIKDSLREHSDKRNALEIHLTVARQDQFQDFYLYRSISFDRMQLLYLLINIKDNGIDKATINPPTGTVFRWEPNPFNEEQNAYLVENFTVSNQWDVFQQ